MNRLVLICIVLASAAMAQPEHDAAAPESAPRDAQDNALAELRGMVTEKNFRNMGFATVDEVAKATLGPPIPVYFVRLDQLRDYKPQDDPSGLLLNLNQQIYPVAIEGAVRTSVTLQRSSDRWRATKFGPPKLIMTLDKVRDRLPRDSSSRDFRVVHVAALGTYLLGYQSDKGLMLVPLVDNDEADLKAGKPLKAADAFQRLVPVANRYNGLPM